MTRTSTRVVLCLASMCAACSPDEPPGAPPLPEVTVARPLVRGIVEWDRYTGRLAAIESVEVRARVSGYLQSIHFGEGQLVEEGTLLAVIDPRPFEAEVARARAARQEAHARLTRSKALLAQATAQRSRASSARTLAATRLENAKQALATDSIAKEQVDVRESEFAQAEAELEAAEAAIASAEADIATSEAAILTAEAEVERAELDLAYTRIHAPVSGRISDRSVTRGNLIQGGNVGATLLTRIVSLDPIHVYFDANEQAYLKYVRLSSSGARASSREVKNPIYVALIDEEGYPHVGHIDFVDNRIDPNTGTMRARGILRNEDLTLTPGLFATVQIPGSARYDAVMIPDEAIGASQAQRYVFALSAEDIVEPRPVELGPMVDGLRVIRAGLDGGERVVVRGLQRVRPGVRVKPTDGQIEADELSDGLPDDYQPVPEEEWITFDSETSPAQASTTDR